MSSSGNNLGLCTVLHSLTSHIHAHWCNICTNATWKHSFTLMQVRLWGSKYGWLIKEKMSSLSKKAAVFCTQAILTSYLRCCVLWGQSVGGSRQAFTLKNIVEFKIFIILNCNIIITTSVAWYTKFWLVIISGTQRTDQWPPTIRLCQPTVSVLPVHEQGTMSVCTWGNTSGHHSQGIHEYDLTYQDNSDTLSLTNEYIPIQI